MAFKLLRFPQKSATATQEWQPIQLTAKHLKVYTLWYNLMARRELSKLCAPQLRLKMLRDIQTYIAKHGVVSIADLSLHFHTDSNTLQPMLTKLRRKGRIRKLPTPAQCAGCTSCDLSRLECYEWVRRE